MCAAKKQQKAIRLKELEQWLQRIGVFENPKVNLEQYTTTPHLAACMLHTIHMTYDDIEDRCIADLGVGCGVLGIGCCMLGADYVLGVDIDQDALEICSANVKMLDISNMDLVQNDIHSLVVNPGRLEHAFDTVIMNPPFGTKNNAGIDMVFIKAGLQLSSSSVYSLHKTATREHILKKAAEWNIEAEVLAELRYNLDNTMRHHLKVSEDIKVDFYRFSHKTKLFGKR